MEQEEYGRRRLAPPVFPFLVKNAKNKNGLIERKNGIGSRAEYRKKAPKNFQFLRKKTSVSSSNFFKNVGRRLLKMADFV
jgi:hypothetical protein